MDFSLFYFADSDAGGLRDRYRLLLEGARFADNAGFAAVWTPERHFHPFGGQYPNPAVTGAALAAATERVAIRAGSVVAPLHHPLRIAEEWSVVDNLSGGRVGVSFASGWHAVDFVLRPENFQNRKKVMTEAVDTVRRLWRGEKVAFPDPDGQSREVGIYPPPIQPELPVWITSAGTPETFRSAGRIGAGVLTHLLGQDHDTLRRNIAAYRAELAATHGAEARGHVALMLHTLIGDDRDGVRALVRKPFSDYLRSSIDLVVRPMSESAAGVDLSRLPERDREFLVTRAFDRYFGIGGLFGTVADGLETVRGLAELGVDEVACLIDFGVEPSEVLRSLSRLGELHQALRA